MKVSISSNWYDGEMNNVATGIRTSVVSMSWTNSRKRPHVNLVKRTATPYGRLLYVNPYLEAKKNCRCVSRKKKQIMRSRLSRKIWSWSGCNANG